MIHINFWGFLDPCTATEAKVVRDVLLANRVDNVKSVPILYVIRVFFRNHHGLYKQLSCPIYGITEAVFRMECEFRMNLKRALSMFIVQRQYQYACLGFALGESLRAEVCAQMDKVRLGQGEDVVQSVMDGSELSNCERCKIWQFASPCNSTEHGWSLHTSTGPTRL